ncbi:MAG: protein kinase [Methylobacter sp.]|uniref:serine/threonine-protein kinase n=1 Tax=Methylobacter sp. TaxID=2051955 RepID=UPI0025831F14|nr:protein kinase [Methylobacter sp.]MCL7423368.1 protein kinase [Methylobacter sp.]
MNADNLAYDATQIAPAGTGRGPSGAPGTSKHAPARDDDATVLTQPVKKTAAADNEAAAVTTATYREIHKEEKFKLLKVGSILNNRFVLKEVLGSGGMGTVFRATDLRRQEAQDQQTDVALKVLNEEFRDNPELFVALQRETRKSQMLAHPNIVNVYDFDRDGSNIFMVMEILEGKSLSQYIHEIAPQGGIPFDKAWPIIEKLASVLGYAHKKNIIHSDFKPCNIFITDSGEIKVLDFGIACASVRSDRHSHDKTVFNARDLGALTPAYASLEMFENREPDPRDDIYALACISYELLAGKHPFAKLSAQKALEVNLQPPAIPGLKRRQFNALAHALELKREHRTVSITQFLEEIEPKSPWPNIIRTARIAAFVAVAGGSVYVYQSRDTEPAVMEQLPEPAVAEQLPEPAAMEQLPEPIVAEAGPMTEAVELAPEPEVVELTPEQQLQVKNLLELAQIHFEVGYITAPSGSNALWTYRQALSIDPDNQEAQQGLEKIADWMEEQAITLFDQQKFDESLAKVEEGLAVLPEKDSLLTLKQQILKMR